MIKSFYISFVALVLVYIYVPELSSFIKFCGVLTFICQLAAIASHLIIHSNYSPKNFVSPINRLVLITGCDSGFGLSTARRLDYYGFYVLAGVLSTESEGSKYLNTYGSNRLRTIKLDVTKQEDVDKAVDLVAYLTNYKPNFDRSHEKYIYGSAFNPKFKQPIFGNVDGDLRLQALVNNAGVAQFVPFEFGTIERDLMPMFEVNIFGMIRMAKAFLPFLRQSPNSRLVNVGSVTDRVTIAGLTGYSMSKHAVKSLTDGLRQELKRFDIRSILIEPTLYKTPISNIDQLVKKFDQTYDRTDKQVQSDYGSGKFKESFTSHLKKMIVLTRTNIDEVVNSIVDAVVNVKPQDQYWCASLGQKFLFWVIEQLNLEFTDRLCTIQPPQEFVDFVQKINSTD